MRAPSRAGVLAAIVAAALALNAQESCPPPPDPEMHWVGQSSGCTEENGSPCAIGETIVFSVTPLGGGSYPACVTYLWDFDDGGTSTAASPSHVYVADGTFGVFVTIRGGTGEAGAGKIITMTAVPIVERFDASARVVRSGQTVTLSWSTINATSVLIDPINVRLDATVTSHPIVVTVTRTYTLTALGAAALGFSKKSVTVVVGEPRRRAVRH